MDVDILVGSDGLCYAQLVVVCNIPVASIVPRHQNLIVALFTGAFDTSIGVYTLVDLGYRAGVKAWVSFYVLGFCGAALMMILALSAMVGLDYRELASNKVEPCQESMDNDIEGSDLKTLEMENLEKLDKYVNSRYPNLRTIFSNRFFWLQCLFFGICFFRFTFFLAQMSAQLVVAFGKDNPELVPEMLVRSNYFFMSAVLMSPVAGIVTSSSRNRAVAKHKDPATSDSNKDSSERLYGSVVSSFAPSMLVCAIATELLAIIVIFPQLWAFYVCFVAVVVIRAFLFSVHAAFLLQCFPRKNFGMVYGVTLLFAGAASAIQFGIRLGETAAELNPVNYGLIVVTLLSFIQPLFLIVSHRLPTVHCPT